MGRKGGGVGGESEEKLREVRWSVKREKERDLIGACLSSEMLRSTPDSSLNAFVSSTGSTSSTTGFDVSSTD